jgi:energy-coupling factor transporter transmembrane protein EcfT
MVLAADYPFLDILWTMIIFFAWVVWIWMMIVILSDVFRRRDLSGGAKAGWIIFLLVLPFIGVLVYLAKHSEGIADRRTRDEFGDSARSAVAGGGTAGEIEKAKALLDSGAITGAEYDAIKAKALA